MKGVFNLRPPVARYCEIWDVDIVLVLLRKLSPVKDLDFKQLTFKLVMLMALVSVQRAQTLHLLKISNMKKSRNGYTFLVVDVIKQSRPGYKPPVLELKAYPPDRRLCVYTVLKEFLFRREGKGISSDNLFISYQRPHGSVTSITISRWLRTVMARAGINTTLFKAHSVRAAVSSKAKAAHVPVKEIMERAGWSRESTFAKFYEKRVVKDQFAETILKL